MRQVVGAAAASREADAESAVGRSGQGSGVADGRVAIRAAAGLAVRHASMSKPHRRAVAGAAPGFVGEPDTGREVSGCLFASLISKRLIGSALPGKEWLALRRTGFMGSLAMSGKGGGAHEAAAPSSPG